jgi:hypothetical protein
MKKGTLISVLVFAGLLAVVLLTRENKVREGVPTFDWKAPPQEQVTKVEIQGPNRALLTKTPEGWKVADPQKPDVTFATDESQVTSMLSALGEFKAGDSVTSRAERLKELELDDEKGLKVTVSGDTGVLAALVLGKAAKSGGHYVKLPSSPDVFTTSARLAYLVKKDVGGWRKHSIIALKPEDLVSIKVTQPTSELSLAFKDGNWTVEPTLPPAFRFDAQAAQRLAQQLATLSAQDFGTDASVATDKAQLSAQTKDGKTVSISVGAEANGTVPVRLEGDAQVYLVGSWAANQLVKKLEDLRDLSLSTFDAEKVQRLSVVAGAKKAVVAKEDGTWKLVEPKAPPAGFDFDGARVASVLGRLRAMKGLRVDSSAAAKAACKKPATATVELELEGNQRQQIRFGGELGQNELCATGSADALTYVTSKAERAWLETGVELFKRLPPPRHPPGGPQGLDQLPPDLRAKIEAQLRQQQQQPPQPH